MIIGIDLGTTNSLAAYFSEDGPKIIPNRLGKHLTPSVVSVGEDGEIYVGETAKERRNLHPDDTAQVFKRSMGSAKKFNLNGKEFTAEELSSLVLRSLKEDAEAFLGETVEEAVISVPAYFDDKRRKATKRAGELAGLTVERIISEPTAAAIAYGLYEKKKNTRFLVFDLGGGTFDVSILELFENILEVRAVAGDNYLGGEDFTEVLEKYFCDQKGIDREDLDEKTLVQLHRQAELCKLEFSEASSAVIRCTIDGEERELTVTQKDYESLCEPLLEKIRKPVQRSLADAHIKLADIDEVVLVGGGTKFPIVRSFIVKLFRKFPDTSINPDEAVALGAAVQGAMKERNQAVKEVILTDVCSFTLGTEITVNNGNGRYESGHFCPIIERNTVIPASRTERFYTVHDDQTKVSVNILQGESRFAANNLLLGELEVRVPKNKAGAEAVDVTYTYDINSILEVEVKVLSTGEVKKQIIKSQDNEMTEEEIEQRMEELSYLKIHPRDQEENKLLLFRCERLYEESTGEERQRMEYEIRRFESALNTQDRGRIEEARSELKEFLKDMD
ncbi:molecular chaperone HscC [Cuneatibacter sp. NSJ-177]|uniref:molecular chaperone HscC n=1 Tax=Cuneatibacter sp. NSJ-177 TaxID=2931401 RepID=UPI001FD49157|nr:molecular chaperone HscC [Cuneatibacter sp. NSJ-177]